MSQNRFDTAVEMVTGHNLAILAVMLVLTGGMVAGAAQLGTGDSADADAFPETDAAAAGEYIETAYANGEQVTNSVVYVQDENGNVLSKNGLLGSLQYQRTVFEDEAVAESIADDGTHSVANLVATELLARSDGEPGESPSLDQQIAALESASTEEVSTAVETVLAPGTDALALVPESYEPGTATAASHQMLFQFADSEDGAVPSDAQQALYSAASDRPGYFTLGEHAMSDANDRLVENTMELVVPIALILLVGILAVTYRDPVDVIVGMVGVVASIIWMFGILGWLGISAGMTTLIGPVLIAGLSIDFSFHVFNRYREQRAGDGGDGIRAPMGRGVRSVAVALALVTVTAAIGFLSNVVNTVGTVRNLGIGIALGVVSAFVIFLTLVPALKITIDRLLGRVGFDRRNQPLGHGRLLRPALERTVSLARRGAPVVLVVALVVGAGGIAAWSALDEESFQQQTGEAAEWKQELPGPLAWEDPEFTGNQQYVQEQYRAVASDESDRFQILVEGTVTSDGSLRAIHEATDRTVFESSHPTERLVSPVTVVQSVAAENEAFGETVAAADGDGDGIPDSNLATVFDHLYEVAPEKAQRVVERTDSGYESLRIIGPAESAGFQDDRSGEIVAAAGAIESSSSGLDATAVSESIVTETQLDRVTDGILQVMVLAIVAVLLTLIAVFRRVHGSATVGAVTAVPIALVTAMVVGGMYLLGVPLTLLTALLMSLVIGLGIDYNIHVADRFLQELDRGRSGPEALETAVVGTGGALLGSALTSAAAFISLLIHPHPQIESFGILVTLALLSAFVVSVFVLPSALLVWWRYRGIEWRQQETPSETESASAD